MTETTEKHPYVILAEAIARKYVWMSYCLCIEPPAEDAIEFELVDSLWTPGRWSVDLKANLDGDIYRVVHNGTNGEVTDVIYPDPIEDEETEVHG